MTTIQTESSGPDLGYAYTVDLCEAIAESLESAPAGAFDYKGADLTQAVTRTVYMTLVNNATLKRRYADRQAARPVERFSVPTKAERLGAVALTGTEVVVDAPQRRWRSRAHAWLDARSALPRTEAELPVAGVVFVMHSPKFLRFAEPLLASIERPVVVNTGHDFTESLAELGVPGLPLDTWPAAIQACGSLLEDRADLLATFDRLEACFAQLKPRAVVVFEGNHAFDELANRAARALDIPCFCIQHGWSPIVHNGFRGMTFSAMLVWGEGFAELLRAYNPNESFVATGNPALDHVVPQVSANPVVTFFAQGPSQLLSASHVDDFLALACETARAQPDARILVREHPSSPLRPDQTARLAVLPNVRLVSPEDRSLADVLSETHVSVSIYSTTILESAAFLVPPVVYNTTSLPRYFPDIDSLGAGIEARERDAALATIDRLLHDRTAVRRLEPGMQEVRARFFNGLDGLAAQRIAETIEAGS